MSKYKAHYNKFNGTEQDMYDHLINVMEMAGYFAKNMKIGDKIIEEVKAIALLHDLGKYGDKFQEKLNGASIKVDHSSAGAKILNDKYNNRQLAAVVEAHHTGLKTLSTRDWPKLLEENFSLDRSDIILSEASVDKLMKQFEADGLILPTSLPSYIIENGKGIEEMLYTRMLLSCLVDADYYDTSIFFEGKPRLTPHTFHARDLNVSKLEQAIKCLETTIKSMQNESMSDVVRRVRNQILIDCNTAAMLERGFFSLTAPTGGGKTAAQMSLGLQHALMHNLSRIVIISSFLTIIDQNAKFYKNTFKSMGDDFILEHHSLITPRTGDTNSNSNYFVENWNAEIVMTSSVQFLESLFSDTPSACRKLHRLANSVIIIDEIQALPHRLIIPTLAALDCLVKNYGCTVVFSTATQPPYDLLKNDLPVLGISNYKVTEIIKNGKQIFCDMSRVKYTYIDAPMTWCDVGTGLAKRHQVLCIVNRKQDVKSLYDALCQLGIDENNILCLTTNLCPYHRLEVIAETQKRLKSGQRCILLSTQCIEAGVNIDFPSVWRAAGPLEAILQSGGRGNRHGLMATSGEVIIFKPTTWNIPDTYPSLIYYIATKTALEIIKNGYDLDDPITIREYYRRFYQRSAITSSTLSTFNGFVQSRNFKEIKNHYKLINETHIRVLVPHNPKEFEILKNDIQQGLTAKWIRKSQKMMVNVICPKQGSSSFDSLQPLTLRDGTVSNEYYVLARTEQYHPKYGLLCD